MPYNTEYPELLLCGRAQGKKQRQRVRRGVIKVNLEEQWNPGMFLTACSVNNWPVANYCRVIETASKSICVLKSTGYRPET